MKPTNVLILYTDQQRWDAVGANGNRHIRTPNLDQLARDGVNFDRHFVQNPVCMPSRVSFLTGQYPSTLGITHMGVPVPEDTLVLPRILGNHGYTSANIGKLHFLPHANRDHREVHPSYGFDHLQISDEPGSYEDAHRAWVRRKAPDQLDLISLGEAPLSATWKAAMGIDDQIVHPEERFPLRALGYPCRSDVTHSAFVADQCLEFLSRQGSDPFLCIAGFYPPHSPWIAPWEFLDLYDPDDLPVPDFPPELQIRRVAEGFTDEQLRAARHGYFAMVSEVDDHIGHILAGLDSLGLADNTIVVFTSDHGEWLGEHLRYGKGYPAHDCVSRVPLIVRWPAGIIDPGRTEHGIVEAVDVLPTLLAGAGIQIPPQVQGTSLLPALEAQPFSGRETALTEMHGWKSQRNERFRYLVEADGKESLYDLAADTAGYAEVSDDPAMAAALAEARHQLVTRMVASERPLPRIWPY